MFDVDVDTSLVAMQLFQNLPKVILNCIKTRYVRDIHAKHIKVSAK